MSLPFKISTLLFLNNDAGELLLLRRQRPPNQGCWSPPGGKLEMNRGESPVECARRECLEETGLELEYRDFHLFAYVAEKNYQGNTHWLMFLVKVLQPVDQLPPDISEGQFAFFKREAISGLLIPETDHQLVWPFYDRYRDSFVGVRADCSNPAKLEVSIEVSLDQPRKNR